MSILSALVAATGVITSTNAVATATKVVVVGGVTYTFRAAVGATANEILIGADGNACLANLASAINKDTNTTKYGTATLINPKVSAGAADTVTHKLIVSARTPGTLGNLIASTTDDASLSWGAATLGSGTGATAGSGSAGTALAEVSAYIAARMVVSQQNSQVITEHQALITELNALGAS